MTNKPESAAVEAVAWLVLTNGLPLRYCRTREKAERVAASYGNPTTIEPLYPKSALDALRGEVERLRGALERIAAPHDCGCKPCTSTCRSDLALQITVEAMREEAREALTKVTP